MTSRDSYNTCRPCLKMKQWQDLNSLSNLTRSKQRKVVLSPRPKSLKGPSATSVHFNSSKIWSFNLNRICRKVLIPLKKREAITLNQIINRCPKEFQEIWATKSVMLNLQTIRLVN